MNKVNRIYTFDINSELDEALKKFQDQLQDNEEIVSSEVADKKLVVLVRENKNKRSKNLLLE